MILIFCLLQEFSTDMREDETSSIEENPGKSCTGSRESSSSTPSPEVYESSPRTERLYNTENPGKYIVTSI